MDTTNDRLLKPTGAQIMPLQVLDFGYEAIGFGVFPAGLLLYEEEQAESHRQEESGPFVLYCLASLHPK